MVLMWGAHQSYHDVHVTDLFHVINYLSYPRYFGCPLALLYRMSYLNGLGSFLFYANMKQFVIHFAYPELLPVSTGVNVIIQLVSEEPHKFSIHVLRMHILQNLN